MSTYIKDEAAARVAALRYNEGTYAAVSRATGLAAASLSAWHRKLHTPRPTSLTALREFTIPPKEDTPAQARRFGIWKRS